MNPRPAPTQTSGSARSARAAQVPLSGSWLILARVTWGTVVVLALEIVVSYLPTSLALLKTVFERATCTFARLTPTAVQALSALGLSHLRDMGL